MSCIFVEPYFTFQSPANNEIVPGPNAQWFQKYARRFVFPGLSRHTVADTLLRANYDEPECVVPPSSLSLSEKRFIDPCRVKSRRVPLLCSRIRAPCLWMDCSELLSYEKYMRGRVAVLVL